MNIGKFSPAIEKEINESGYHIFNQSLPSNCYPNKFPKFNKIDKINIGKIYGIRLFIGIGTGVNQTIDSGLISILILSKASESFVGEILTLIPNNFPIAKGQHINLTKDNILYEQI